MKLHISANDRIVLKLSKLEFKSTRRKKIDFGNEVTVLNESSSSRVFVILAKWSFGRFGPQKIMSWYLNLRVKVAIGQQRVRKTNKIIKFSKLANYIWSQKIGIFKQIQRSLNYIF